VHGNQGCRACRFSSAIELGRDAIVIGLEYLPNARELVTFAQADISRHSRPDLHYRLSIEFLDAVNGATKRLTLPGG
jgi:hypothetical protein